MLQSRLSDVHVLRRVLYSWGVHIQGLKVLVMDEADKLLDMDFEQEINQILTVIPRKRQTMLFSATMTSKVKKLQRASLNNPVRVREPHISTAQTYLCSAVLRRLAITVAVCLLLSKCSLRTLSETNHQTSCRRERIA